MVCFICNASFVLSLYKGGVVLSNMRLAGKNVQFGFWAQLSRAVMKTAQTKNRRVRIDWGKNMKAAIRTDKKSFRVPWLEIRFGGCAFVSSNPTHCAEPVSEQIFARKAARFGKKQKWQVKIRLYLTNLLLSIWIRSLIREKRGLCPC